MSRELRRHPLQKKGVPRDREKAISFKAPARQQAPATRAQQERKQPFWKRLVPKGVQDIISELRKVTWPTLSDTWYLSTMVMVVAVAVGVVLGLIDLGFGWVMERLLF
jgi:preprotein translocase subunit SecE